MERLREHMEEKQMTQAELAKRMRVSQPTISDWLNGVSKPTTDNLLKLKGITGLTLDELLEDDPR